MKRVAIKGEHDMKTFPKDFLWGAATSAYQIEGASNVDCKGVSIWDRFSSIPGNVQGKAIPSIACDHYKKFEEDIKLMKELNLKAYRFSISWSRIFPEGTGKINQKGLDFYKRLTSLLRENDITPMVTLFHWDLPQKLQELGGWTNPATIEGYVDFAGTMFRSLGNDVNKWITHNEPWVHAYLGHAYGLHAPGIKDPVTAFHSLHNILISHGKAVKEFRRQASSGEIGITSGLDYYYPYTDSTADIEACQRSFDAVNGTFLEPIFKGKYPEKYIKWLENKNALPDIDLTEIKHAQEKIDFLGVNYYTSYYVKHEDGYDWPLDLTTAIKSSNTTKIGWEVVPKGLSDIVTKIYKDYAKIPIYITENGAAYEDTVEEDGSVHDNERIEFFRQHISQVHELIQKGFDIRGYIAWSFMDNIEWAYGDTMRFGLIHNDYQSQTRKIKDSGKWYSQLIQSNELA